MSEDSFDLGDEEIVGVVELHPIACSAAGHNISRDVSFGAIYPVDPVITVISMSLEPLHHPTVQLEGGWGPAVIAARIQEDPKEVDRQ